MASLSRLGKQIEEVIAVLNSAQARFALIGGLALASHNVVRATQDIDLLTDSSIADRIDEELLKLGYRCLHRSADAANYSRGDERVDFLFASRPIARRLLADAEEHKTAFGVLRIVSTEGLIRFKLQGWVNDPRRTQDLEDIRALLRANRQGLKLEEVREYLKQPDLESPSRSPQPLADAGGIATAPRSERDPYEVLDDLMTVIEALCPVWPERETFDERSKFLL